MILTKYKVPQVDGFTEFMVEADAVQFCTDNGIDAALIETVEEDFPDLVQNGEGNISKPPIPDIIDYNLSIAISERRAIALRIIEEVKKDNLKDQINLAQALWLHHRLRALAVTIGGVDYVLDLFAMVVAGDLETACSTLGATVADDMSEAYHWLSQERITAIRHKILVALGYA